MDKGVVIGLIVCTLVSSICGDVKINPDIQNVNVESKIDLTTHVVKITSDVTFVNNGDSAVRTYYYGLPTVASKTLAHIGARLIDSSGTTLEVVPEKATGVTNVQLYRINLPTAASAGKSIRLSIDTVYPHTIKPFPVEILQSEKQLVVYEGHVYFYSPYTTTTQSTTVQTASSTIESYTKTKPTSIKENMITYGPYENVAPYTESSMRVHYENNNPFLTITDLQRIIEVSHWGNIAVEEHIDISHTGAKLKGPFSRYHYQRMQDGVSSVRAFKTILPSSAKDVYYRDEIGNISTSNMREMDDAVEVELRPRFPLFGGWNTHYYLGYNVPSYEYLYNHGDQYVLKMRFVDHIIDDQVIDHASVKVILPEGATDITVSSPYAVTREEDYLHHTYLDVTGRPVVTLSKNTLVEQHISDFEVHYTYEKILLLQEPLLVVAAVYLLYIMVHYTYEKILLLQEPLLVVAAFYLLCIVVIIYVRLDFSITKDAAKEARMRAASLVDEVRSMQDRREALHQSYDDAVKKFKASKDTSTFKASVKKIDADYRSLTQQIDTIVGQLKAQGSDAADKVAELQRSESSYKEQITLSLQYAEKVVSGKMGRQVYDENDTATANKRADISSKIEAILETL